MKSRVLPVFAVLAGLPIYGIGCTRKADKPQAVAQVQETPKITLTIDFKDSVTEDKIKEGLLPFKVVELKRLYPNKNVYEIELESNLSPRETQVQVQILPIVLTTTHSKITGDVTELTFGDKDELKTLVVERKTVAK